jgi:hypothetical protein
LLAYQEPCVCFVLFFSLHLIHLIQPLRSSQVVFVAVSTIAMAEEDVDALLEAAYQSTKPLSPSSATNDSSAATASASADSVPQHDDNNNNNNNNTATTTTTNNNNDVDDYSSRRSSSSRSKRRYEA